MKKRLKLMNEYWVVKDNKSGRIIAHCGDINDAIMMVSFDSHNRSYSRYRFIMDQVIDITSTTDKQLPGQIGLPMGKVDQLNPHREKLPEGSQEPVIV
jgi:hypothetical protein